MKKNNEPSPYSTVNDDDGVNYRDIAKIMTLNGFKMNHSSVRNYVIRIMRKFAAAYVLKHQLPLDGENLDRMARSSSFQKGISDVLHSLNIVGQRHTYDKKAKNV